MADAPILTRLTSAPKVGRWYRVPAIRMDRQLSGGEQWPASSLERALWWPVTGTRHTDQDHFRFPYPHYHLDVRFLTVKHLRHFSKSGPEKAVEEARATPLIVPRGIEYAVQTADILRPRLVRMRCVRDWGDFPSRFAESQAVAGLAAEFDGRQARHSPAGWVCPHRAYPLGQVAPDADGIITCPLHGLRIDAATGRCLAPRKEPAHG
jgi:hypothetical protein